MWKYWKEKNKTINSDFSSKSSDNKYDSRKINRKEKNNNEINNDEINNDEINNDDISDISNNQNSFQWNYLFLI